MGKAKQIILKVITAKVANEFVRQHHYSGKCAVNPKVCFGAYLQSQLHGVMQFGSSMQKSNCIKYVSGTKWNEFLELNRMAFDEMLPKNSESRCIAIAMKLIQKNAPHVKWIISFADGTQCGDGTIYRASGFQLIGITKNSTIYELPNGFRFADIGLRASSHLLKRKVGYKLGEKFSSFKKRTGAKNVTGFQLRYIYLIDKSCKITVPIIPFSRIAEMGAEMYRGEKITRGKSITGNALGFQSKEGVRADLAALKRLPINASDNETGKPSSNGTNAPTAQKEAEIKA